MQTILQCPHCGNAAKTTKVIPPNAKITCTRCRKQFRPSDNSSVKDRDEEVVDSIPLEELLAPDDHVSKVGRPGRGVADRPLRELLTSDGRASRSLPADDDPPGRYNAVTNSILTKSSEFSDALVPAAESSKKRLIGGKQVRFGTTRQYVAVALIFALAGAGYAGFWGFVYLWNYIHKASINAERERAARGLGIKRPVDPNKKAEEAAEPAAPITPPTIVQTEAGKPAQVNDWEVCVESAELAKVDPSSPQEFLIITVRVTNLAFSRRSYRYWSKPGKNTVIRNQDLTYISLVPGTAPNEAERGMNSKETYRDILVLEAAAARWNLDLTLLLPAAKGGFSIHVPTTFVTRPQ